MDITDEKSSKLSSFKLIKKRFAEKSHLLAVAAYFHFNKEREIDQIISIIIVHQSVELALKTVCFEQENTIFIKGGITISFEDALKRTKNVLNKTEVEILKILNTTRNQYQHSAFFDISDVEYMESLIYDSLFIISKLLRHVKYFPDELILILNEISSIENLIDIRQNLGGINP